QSADKAHKRKNRSDKIEIRDDFCFRRQLHLHPAVTYVYVSSLGCKFASLACGLSQRSASLLTLSTSCRVPAVLRRGRAFSRLRVKLAKKRRPQAHFRPLFSRMSLTKAFHFFIILDGNEWASARSRPQVCGASHPCGSVPLTLERRSIPMKQILE